MTTPLPEPHPKDAVILSAARTPFGKILGTLSNQTAVQLGTIALGRALEQSRISADDIDTVLFGQVLQAGVGQNPARQTAIGAGIGWDVPAATINKVCLSGLTAIIDAARLIRTGEATVVAVGGQESMTNAPHLLPGSRKGWKYGSLEALDSASYDGLTDAFDQISMGASTERYTERLGLTREAQDAFAASSHRRARAATTSGEFTDEITPVTIPQRTGDPVVVTTDEGVRPDTAVEVLARLRPSFAPEGTLTAGNSSPLSDGAAALVLSSRENAERLGLDWLAVVGASGQVAGPDNSLHSQPATAIQAALTRTGWDVGDLDLIEINEAFAAVVLHSTTQLGADPEKVNIHGGAIALGHPIGASGARLAGHAAHELARRGVGRAAVALCGGGGQGDALLLWR